MDKVFLVYKTDNRHSYASRDLLGVCDNWAYVKPIINAQASKEGEKISQDDAFNIINIKQTQGYEGEGEFFIEEVNTNVLL
jgi:hypothetical protein